MRGVLEFSSSVDSEIAVESVKENRKKQGGDDEEA